MGRRIFDQVQGMDGDGLAEDVVFPAQAIGRGFRCGIALGKAEGHLPGGAGPGGKVSPGQES